MACHSVSDHDLACDHCGLSPAYMGLPKLTLDHFPHDSGEDFDACTVPLLRQEVERLDQVV